MKFVTIAASIAFATADMVAAREYNDFGEAPGLLTPRNYPNTSLIGIPDKSATPFLLEDPIPFDLRADVNAQPAVWK